jgi:hypothetical protein
MKKLALAVSIFLLITSSCKREMKFSDEKEVNKQICKFVQEYMLITVNKKYNNVVSVRKIQNGDTIQFDVYTNITIAEFASQGVYYRGEYLDTPIFTNFRNSSFRDSCSLVEAAKFFNKFEYDYIKKYDKIPFPYVLSDIVSMKIVYLKNKLIERKYYN